MTDPIEDAKARYWDMLTPDLQEMVERMDKPNQDYFWAYLHLMAPGEIDRVIVGDAYEQIRARVRPMPEGERSTRPFSYAEESISTHGVFGASRYF